VSAVPTLRRTVMVALVAVVVLAGCSSDVEAPEDAAAAESFPVTIKHVYGSTTVERPPQRVVTIGWGSQDAVAALGVVPVATTDFTWGSVDKHLPWFKERVEQLGGPLPEILEYTESDEVDAEQVLSLRPDVILAGHSGITENEYKRLAQIAPTVAFAKTAWVSDWKQVTRDIGAILGKPDEAQRLLAASDEAVAAQARAHPELAGKTFTYGWSMEDGATAVGLYTPDDPRMQVVEQLGLEISPEVVKRSQGVNDFYFDVSLEELDTITADVHVFWANSPADGRRTLREPTFSKWAPIASSRYYMMEQQDLAWASSQPSVLAIPWSIEAVADGISDALAR
jgi:iron complex transport system substrate-binding protein